MLDEISDHPIIDWILCKPALGNVSLNTHSSSSLADDCLAAERLIISPPVMFPILALKYCLIAYLKKF
jgi:hypothetical protein